MTEVTKQKLSKKGVEFPHHWFKSTFHMKHKYAIPNNKTALASKDADIWAHWSELITMDSDVPVDSTGIQDCFSVLICPFSPYAHLL